MIEAVNMYMQQDSEYLKEVNAFCRKLDAAKARQNSKRKSVFEWMNIPEWQDFKLAVAKDKPLIDSVAEVTGVEPTINCLGIGWRTNPFVQFKPRGLQKMDRTIEDSIGRNNFFARRDWHQSAYRPEQSRKT